MRDEAATNRPTPPACAEVSCESPATGSYLFAKGAASVQFPICALHVARLRDGCRPTVVATPGRAPALRIE